MNLFTLNGATINGRAGVLVLAAAAAIAASCGVSANASRGALATAGVNSGAQVTADVSYIPNGRAGLAGQASLLATPTHIQAADAQLQGTSQIVAFLLREIQASVDVLGTAEIQAIPASVLGTASIAGVANVAPEATKVHPGRAGLDSIAGVSITPSPVATRYVVAHITAGAQGRVETTINDVQEAFAPVAGSARITLVEVAAVQRMATAQILATTEIAPVATKRQPGRADVPAIAAFMNTEPFVAIGADAAITAGAALWADGVRVRTAGATSAGASTVSASARTRQVAHASPTGSATLLAHGVRRTPGESAPKGSAMVQAESVRVARGVASLPCAADMFVSSGSLTFAGADVAAGCQMNVAEPVFAEQGFADMGGSCWVENTDVRMAEQGQAALGGSCFMQLWDARVNAFVAVDLLCSADMLAEAVTLLNADTDVLGQSAGFAEALVTRPAAAILDSRSLVTADAWRVQLTGAEFGGSAQAIAQATDYDRILNAGTASTSAAVVAAADVMRGGVATATGAVQIIAQATDYDRILNAGTASTSAAVVAAADVMRGGVATATGAVQIIAQATDYERIQNAAQPTVAAQVTAQATDYERLVQGAVVQPSAQIMATCFATRFVSAQPHGAAYLFALPKTFDRVVDGARVSGTAGMVVGGKLAERGAAAVQAGVSVVADAVALLSPPAVFIYGNAYITADTIANIASMDPPERTFLRPAHQADFVRPAQETEFRRAA